MLCPFRSCRRSSSLGGAELGPNHTHHGRCPRDRARFGAIPGTGPGLRLSQGQGPGFGAIPGTLPGFWGYPRHSARVLGVIPGTLPSFWGCPIPRARFLGLSQTSCPVFGAIPDTVPNFWGYPIPRARFLGLSHSLCPVFGVIPFTVPSFWGCPLQPRLRPRAVRMRGPARPGPDSPLLSRSQQRTGRQPP